MRKRKLLRCLYFILMVILLLAACTPVDTNSRPAALDPSNLTDSERPHQGLHSYQVTSADNFGTTACPYSQAIGEESEFDFYFVAEGLIFEPNGADQVYPKVDVDVYDITQEDEKEAGWYVTLTFTEESFIIFSDLEGEPCEIITFSLK